MIWFEDGVSGGLFEDSDLGLSSSERLYLHLKGKESWSLTRGDWVLEKHNERLLGVLGLMCMICTYILYMSTTTTPEFQAVSKNEMSFILNYIFQPKLKWLKMRFFCWEKKGSYPENGNNCRTRR